MRGILAVIIAVVMLSFFIEVEASMRTNAAVVGWKIACRQTHYFNSSGNFNGDMFADIVWRNTRTGEVYIWLMGPESEELYNYCWIPRFYTVVPIADLNSDGTDDIVIGRSKKRKKCPPYIWLMDGTDILAHGTVAELAQSYTLDTESIDAVDFKADAYLLLKNIDTREIYFWLENKKKIAPLPLTLTCGGASYMMVSEDPTFADTEWEPYTLHKNFKLSKGKGIKTIYAKFKDDTGQEIDGVPVSVMIDTKKPKVSITEPARRVVRTYDPAITIAGTVNKPCFKVLINGQQAVLDGNSFSMGIILDRRITIIRVIAIDLNGNVSKARPYIVVKRR